VSVSLLVLTCGKNVKQEPAVATAKKKDEQTTKRIGAKICFKHFSPLCIFRHPFPQLSTFPSAFCRCSVFVNF